ncbi:MAG: lipopolysaccharide transport periplasmic protein LptA [Pseudomonadota bacterium]|nr:lipopolysaccharide transport periplasmic protein LptA [Pseudomonadota bacterium]
MACRLLPVALAALAATPVWAERADRNQPMRIEADALRYEDQKQHSTFTGNVVVTKGSIVMRGARLDVWQDASGNQFGTMTGASGQRAFFRQKREGLNEFIEGEGDTIEYDGKADTVRFVRRAEMRRLEGARLMDEVKGSVIVYNNTTEVYTVDGSAKAPGTPSASSSGRVSAILAPRGSRNAQAPAAPASAASVPLRPATTLPQGTAQ